MNQHDQHQRPVRPVGVGAELSAPGAGEGDEASSIVVRSGCRVPYLLIYAGERADRPATKHDERWSAHLHGADGEYVATTLDGSPTPLDATADAALCARAVTAWLHDYLGAAPPHATP
ncbi:hypothetical protein [Streptomyces virginiae]|uniref:hypothetical protein n=1 Tax=Streptomyces virginiae TaxID=1961 RepID=UPI00343FD167